MSWDFLKHSWVVESCNFLDGISYFIGEMETFIRVMSKILFFVFNVYIGSFKENYLRIFCLFWDAFYYYVNFLTYVIFTT